MLKVFLYPGQGDTLCRELLKFLDSGEVLTGVVAPSAFPARRHEQPPLKVVMNRPAADTGLFGQSIDVEYVWFNHNSKHNTN